MRRWTMDEVIAAERELVAGLVPAALDFLSGFEQLAGKRMPIIVRLDSSKTVSTSLGSAVNLPVWGVAPEPIRALYLEWSEGDVPLARRWFDLSFYWFYFVHEIGHTVQDYLEGLGGSNYDYTIELNANEWATAYWYGKRGRTREHDEWERLTERVIRWGREKGYPERVTPENFKHHASCELGYYGYQEWVLVRECRERAGELTYGNMLGKWGEDFLQGFREKELRMGGLDPDECMEELRTCRIGENLRKDFAGRDIRLADGARIVQAGEERWFIEDGGSSYTIIGSTTASLASDSKYISLSLYRGRYDGRKR